MQNTFLAAEAVTHQTYSVLLKLAGRSGRAEVERLDDGSIEPRDRGAVSLEQVLWFVAAGVSVAAISAIIWGTIKAEAEKDPVAPTRP